MLVAVIHLVTNIAFFGRLSRPVSPANHHLGWLVLFVPVAGGLLFGVMARYGSKAIRGHGIPEAMEQVLLNESRIPARVTFLKPLSAAISIGTGAPELALDVRVCALVGMAAMSAGASRALLASVVFAFETTLQPLGLLPLLGGCTAGYLVSSLLMRNTIMTEKLARRGVRVPTEYAADYLDLINVADACTTAVVAMDADEPIARLHAMAVAHTQ